MEWKTISDCSGRYLISDNGKVKSMWRDNQYGRCYYPEGQLLKTQIGNDDYERISLYCNGKRKKMFVHRLVAEAFIPNPEGLPQVNHKDENRKNNCVENLEWCDAKYNANYGNRSKTWRKSLKSWDKPIVKLTPDFKVVSVYNNIWEIAEEGYSFDGVAAVVRKYKYKSSNGEYKTRNLYSGFRWMYLKEFTELSK